MTASFLIDVAPWLILVGIPLVAVYAVAWGLCRAAALTSEDEPERHA